MPIYLVEWTEEVTAWTNIEADSQEEALEMAKSGQYIDADSEPNGKKKKYNVREGRNHHGAVTKK